MQDLISHLKTSLNNADAGISRISKELIQMKDYSKTSMHFYNNLANMTDVKYLDIGTRDGNSLFSAMCRNTSTLYSIIDSQKLSYPKEDLVTKYYVFKGQNYGNLYDEDMYTFDVSQLTSINILSCDLIENNNYFELLTHYYTCLDSSFIFIASNSNDNIMNNVNTAFHKLGLKVLYEKEINNQELYVAVLEKTSSSPLNIPINTPKSTVVTMYFNLKKMPDSTDSVRPIDFYIKHGKKTLDLPYQMVVFCDKETRPFIEEMRNNLPTIYVEKNIAEYDYFKELYPKIIENRKVLPSPDPRNTASYFLLTMFKFKAIEIAKNNNYYPDTSHYFWVDFGGSHLMRGFPDAVHKILDNPRPKISCGYIHYRPDSELYPIQRFMTGGNKCSIGATCFSVEAKYANMYSISMFEIMREHIALGVGHAEEQCMAYCYSKNPQWFNLYFADYYSLVTNYHKTVDDINCIKYNFINNAINANRDDLVLLAYESMS